MGVIQKLADYFNVGKSYFLEDVPDQTQGYYTDPEVAEYAEELRTNPELRVLFSSSRNLTKEQMQEAYNFIKFLKMKEENKVHDD